MLHLLKGQSGLAFALFDISAAKTLPDNLMWPANILQRHTQHMNQAAKREHHK